jgi:hypothetical protein
MQWSFVSTRDLLVSDYKFPTCSPLADKHRNAAVEQFVLISGGGETPISLPVYILKGFYFILF